MMPFMTDIVKSIHAAENVSNCALRTFQRTLSEITELGAFLEGPYGETCKIANLRKWVGPELSTRFPHSLVC